MKNRFKPTEKKDTTNSNPFVMLGIPTDMPVGIYPRQSSIKQYGNVSTMIQHDYTALAERYGWKQENVIVYGEDAVVSGQKRMDERKGFSRMLNDIINERIKAVFVVDIDRLFRDRYGTEYSKFMEICEEHGVVIVTPDMVYNFAIDTHVIMFRQRCQMAADFLKYQVENRLVGGKNFLMSLGFYAGNGLPVGLDVDRNPKSPKYRKYIPYEPHAKVVRWVYQRFFDLGGDFSKLWKEVRVKPVLFPAFEPNASDELVHLCKMRRVPGGFHLSRTSLRRMLYNPTYAGYFIHDGVLREGNHETLVSNNLFFYAFNRLSPFHLDGTENTERLTKRIRYERHGTTDALLKGILTTDLEGYGVFVKRIQRKSGVVVEYYSISKHWGDSASSKLHVPISNVDEAVKDRILEHLARSQDFINYQTYLDAQQQSAQEEEQNRLAQLSAAHRAIAALKENLKRLTDPDLVGVMEEEYKVLKADQQRLSVPSANVAEVAELMAFRDLINTVQQGWQKIPLTKHVTLMRILMEKITLEPLSPRFFRLVVTWRDPTWGTEECVLRRTGRNAHGIKTTWTEEEEETLRGLEHATEIEVLEAIPMRSYVSIRQRVYDLGLPHPCMRKRRPTPEGGHMCWKDEQVLLKYGMSGSSNLVWLS